ncbi:FRG domain-containing protein [Cardiobacterium hominis]|uniref:FRG domain-containing protein n=1 Tax=Cardiobacterium hominis TaxID=2718 RepID=UPI0028D720CE|nr:FRG domain-containing protein [Cardiobacterium hominis]
MEISIRFEDSCNSNQQVIVEDISGFSNILKKLGEPANGYMRFFRGHGNKEWGLLPGIYRDDNLVRNEDKIIKDALTYCPDYFRPSDTLFEKLARLQHYGYATRLLDLTSNALVSLYFAASGESNKDGEIIVLDIPKSAIKYDDSDTVAILSALSIRESGFNILSPRREARQIAELSGLSFAKKEQQNFIGSRDSAEHIEAALHQIDIMKEHIVEQEYIKHFNSNNEIIKLLHDIMKDKPYFKPIINPEDLNKVLCIRAKLDNYRIMRQQGCFLLFGINERKNEPACLNDKWKKFLDNEYRIIVPKENKEKILQELRAFAISKQTLFPELDMQAQDIMDKYKS